jgi:hypothetical protein
MALKQKALFYDGKKIAVAQNIKNIQKTSGGISYVAHDYSSDTDTLFYNGKAVVSAYEIPDYVEDDGNRLAYTTFTFTGKTPPKDSGYMSGEYPTKMTLFEDGKEVASAGGIELKKISGKLAYIIQNEKSQLYYDGKVIQSADYIDKLTEVAGKPAYTATDYSTKERRLFLGDRLITKTQMAESIQFRDVGGKLVYSVYDSSAQENVTFYDEQKIPNVHFYSLQEVNGKLAYITYDQSQKGSLVYDNQKVGGDYDIKSAIAFKSVPGVLYFTTLEETESSTLISIYKLNLQ